MQIDLQEILKPKELIWKQKSREIWLKGGEDKNKNKKFLLIRRRHNKKNAIKEDNQNCIFYERRKLTLQNKRRK